MAVRKKKTIGFNFSEKHKEYIRNCQYHSFNIAEGAVRAGKTIDNIFAFAYELKRTKDKIHLATGSTVANAKLNIGDANGFGLEYIFRGQCRWSKYKDNDALVIKGISTNNKTKVVIFAGGSKSDSYKKIRGNSFGMWIATEINLHHDNTIKEAFNRTVASSNRKFFWDLNPDHPRATIYTDYIDKYRDSNKAGWCNYEHFTIDDNINISDERKDEIKAQYDPSTVWYQRDILGRRMIAEGLVYRRFADRPSKHIVPHDESVRFDYIGIGVDFGGNKSKHSFVATGIADNYNTLYALASERHEPDDTDKLSECFIAFVRKVIRKYGRVDGIYVDSAEQVLKRTLQKALDSSGIYVIIRNSIKNEINDRIRAVTTLIYEGRFFLIENETETLNFALSTAVWNPKEIKPVRLDDGTTDIDTLDSFEYSFERYIRKLVSNIDVSKID